MASEVWGARKRSIELGGKGKEGGRRNEIYICIDWRRSSRRLEYFFNVFVHLELPFLTRTCDKTVHRLPNLAMAGWSMTQTSGGRRMTTAPP